MPRDAGVERPSSSAGVGACACFRVAADGRGGKTEPGGGCRLLHNHPGVVTGRARGGILRTQRRGHLAGGAATHTSWAGTNDADRQRHREQDMMVQMTEDECLRLGQLLLRPRAGGGCKHIISTQIIQLCGRRTTITLLLTEHIKHAVGLLTMGLTGLTITCGGTRANEL